MPSPARLNRRTSRAACQPIAGLLMCLRSPTADDIRRGIAALARALRQVMP